MQEHSILSFLSDVSDLRSLIVLGAGGVGKTTLSASFALALAQQGKKIALLSIDPSKRLAQALSLDSSGVLKKVVLQGAEAKGNPGELWAATLNEKEVFDSLVYNASKSAQEAKKIIEHKLYHYASTKFGGIGEYMALERVSQLLKDKTFDLVVVDTPPDSHALDFLDRPGKVQSFLNGKILRLVLLPLALGSRFGLGQIGSLGSRLLGGLSRVTGLAALTVLAEFMVMMRRVIADLAKSSEQLQSHFQSREAGFIVVATSRPSALGVARELSSELLSRKLPLRAFVLSRVLGFDPKAGAVGLDEEYRSSWQHFQKIREIQSQQDLDAKKTLKAELAAMLGEKPLSFLEIKEGDAFLFTKNLPTQSL